jgi:hypothetical protein
MLIGALLFPVAQVHGQRSNAFSTKAIQELSKALTDDVDFGVPRYTTALLPTCDTASKGALAWDTTTNSLKGCNGTSWAAPFDGTLSSGQFLAAGTNCTTAPPYSFTSDPNTGMCNPAANQLGFVVDGAARFYATSTVLAFSGLTASFPAFRRSTTEIQVVLADESNFADFLANKFTSQTAIHPTGAGNGRIRSPENGGFIHENAAGTSQASYAYGTAKTLTDNSATTFARVAIAADTSAVVCLFYEVDAENATDQQVIGGHACVPIINDAGAETCGTIVESSEATTTSVGTISATITCTGAGTSTIDLAMTSDSTLNVSPLLKWQAMLGSSAGVTITAQ